MAKAGNRLPKSALNSLFIFSLIGLFWFVRYSQAGGFGFYGDDYFFVVRAISMTGNEFSDFLTNLTPIIRFQSSGHPLHPVLITIGSRIGWWIGELAGIYWVAFLIGSINIGLFYLLVLRIHSRSLAYISGLIYVLYAADTTQSYLTFALGIQPALSMLLLAGHAFLSKKYWLSYTLSALALLTYETAYAITFAFPLLSITMKEPKRSELLKHLMIISIILLGTIAWRVFAGENRVGQLTFQQITSTPILHMIQGPVVSLGSFFYRPFQIISSPDPTALFATLLIAFYTIGFIYALRIPSNLPAPGWIQNSIKGLPDQGVRQRSLAFWQKLDEDIKHIVLIGISGFTMLILAYPFTFTVRAYAITGRDTRVHAAGVVGAALLLGAITLLLVRWAKTTSWRIGLMVPICIWLGLLGAHGIIVQKDYVNSWKYQKKFWSSINDHIGGLDDGSVLAIDPGGLIDTKHIDANTWNLPYVLHNIYDFPEEWDRTPRAYRLLTDWNERAIVNSTEIKVLDYKWEYVVVPWDQLHLLRTRDGMVSAKENSVSVNGTTYDLRTSEVGVGVPLRENILYDYLIVD